jgi:tRNA-binding protein
MELLTFEQFKKIDIRVGTVVEACIHPTTKKPALQLKIDLGELGIKNSSAQITALYKPENLIKKHIGSTKPKMGVLRADKISNQSY